MNGTVCRTIMLTRNLLLEGLITAGVVTKKLRISPKVQEIFYTKLNLLQSLMTYTNFLRYDASLYERIHCVMQDIKEQPKCSCGKILHMRITGRYANTFPIHCSNKCTSNDELVKQKRKSTNLDRYGAVTPLLKSNV